MKVSNRRPSDAVDSAFPTFTRHSMNKGRFLNQKLGKRATRKIALLKSSLSTIRQPGRPEALAARLPKKGASREKGLNSKFGGV